MGNNEDKTEGIRSSIDDFYSFLPTPGQDLKVPLKIPGVPQGNSPSQARSMPPFLVSLLPKSPIFFIPGLFLITQLS